MPRCKNIPEGHKACYYKGDENTPRGKGLAAQFEEGKNRKGMDGNMYTATNGRWIKKVSSHSSPSRRGKGKKSKRKTSPRLAFPPSSITNGWTPEKRQLIRSIFGNIRQKNITHSDNDIKGIITLHEPILRRINITIQNIPNNHFTLQQIVTQSIVGYGRGGRQGFRSRSPSPSRSSSGGSNGQP